MTSIFTAPFARGELHWLLESAEKMLTDRGLSIAFRGTTERVAMLITVPKRDLANNFSEHYRFRFAVSPCRPETPCIVNAVADLVRVTLPKGKETSQSTRELINDPITQEVLSRLTSMVSESNREMNERTLRTRGSILLPRMW